MLEIEIELLNPHPALARLHGIEERLLHHEEAFDEVMGILEDSERELFRSWNGRYVDTGALRDSLTLPDADGAIRELHPEGADFGSAIPYAVYQRDQGRSAIMRFDETDEQKIAATLLRYIVDGPEGGVVEGEALA